MVRAVEALAAERGFSPDQCHIWLDLHSIPQSNEATKALAIGAIALFAATTSHFVACAPETLHLDTGLLCSRDTYLSRGWCRLEQWAFMLANGTDSIYFWGDASGGLQRIDNVSSWIETSIKVFLGEFTKGEDKELLVDVVLGLYGLAFVSKLQRADGAAERGGGAGMNCDALWEQLQTHKAAIFPAELFGDLVELLETELTDAIAQAARGSGFGPQDSESSVSSHGGLKSKRRSETKQDAFALFDRHGFESVLRASDRLYTQAMREVRRTRQTTTS
mmetsp:Transcript_27034/g.79100  ORF Transcript_27034/g.79100 Transcript_27034/m.79100 type:complete len:277 (+) Transcript_27034:3536-4366(+)